MRSIFCPTCMCATSTQKALQSTEHQNQRILPRSEGMKARRSQKEAGNEKEAKQKREAKSTFPCLIITHLATLHLWHRKAWISFTHKAQHGSSTALTQPCHLHVILQDVQLKDDVLELQDHQNDLAHL